ncbi:universal stress protein [Halorussus halophilus]|uniref:universal stress protein n=1 Tax=Halorussus halophilus TaxID=2650975 RepID=UPI0013012B32|nr:universal stress protein [Halorussus halophilus]
MYDRILLPTDGSEQAEAATEQAFELARNFDAELHVLFVVDSSAFASEVDATLVTDELEAYGTRTLETVVKRAEDAGVSEIESAIYFGTTHEEILAYAEKVDADLVVMGTHGRRGLDRYLLGSVTERLVRMSEVPVLTVRANGGS